MTDRDFRFFWAGQSISVMGTMVTRAALPLTAILVLGSSPFALGLLAAAEAVPVLLLGLFAGALADRVRRRPLMIGADIGRAVLLASVPVAALAGRLTFAHLVAVVACVAALSVIFDVAYQAYLPSLVGRERLVEGNSKLGMSASVAEVGGFSLGGALVQWITAPLAILVDALSFLASALAIGAIRRPEPSPRPSSDGLGVRAEIVEGLRFVTRDGVLRALLLAAVTVSTCGGAFAALYAIHVVRGLGVSPLLYGIVTACGGLGSFVGAALAERAAVRLGLGRVISAALALGGGFQLLVPLAPAPVALAVAFLIGAQVFGDCGLTVYNILDTSLRQTLAPEHALGRVGATFRFVELGAMPVGAIVGGVVGEWASPRVGLLAAATGMAAASLWLAVSAVRNRR